MDSIRVNYPYKLSKNSMTIIDIPFLSHTLQKFKFEFQFSNGQQTTVKKTFHKLFFYKCRDFFHSKASIKIQ